MKRHLILLIIFISAALINAQQVIRTVDNSASLKQQFENAFEKLKGNDNFWIGYSIERKGNHDIRYGTFYSYDDEDFITLRDIVEGTPKAKEYFSQYKNKRKMYNGDLHYGHSTNINTEPADKETAILFRYKKDADGINDFNEIDICSLSHYFELYGFPLVWLGKKGSPGSVDFLIGLYKNAGRIKNKKELSAAVGIHNDQEKVTDFLAGILNSNADSELRKRIPFWLGLQNNSKALSVLKYAVKNDPVKDVRKNVVWGLGFMDMSNAIDELVYIVKHNDERDVRRNAIYALGNKAVKKAEQALKDFVENDPDIEVKKSAVYALANSLKDSVPYLIKIAKTNRSLEIRKAAIYSLSNSKDKRALKALIEIAKN